MKKFFEFWGSYTKVPEGQYRIRFASSEIYRAPMYDNAWVLLSILWIYYYTMDQPEFRFRLSLCNTGPGQISIPVDLWGTILFFSPDTQNRSLHMMSY